MHTKDESRKMSGLFTKILMVFGILGILDGLTAFFMHGGLNFGTVLPLLCGLLLLTYLFFRKSDCYPRFRKWLHPLEKVAAGFFCLWFLSFVVLSSVIVFSAISERKEKVDGMIVLGAGLVGSRPSRTLVERLDAALSYIRQNPDVKVVVSGGKGAMEDISEAEAMKNYLVKHGAPAGNILKEDQSTSTLENLKFSKRVFEEGFSQKPVRDLLVTSDFHMFRAKFLAKRVGLKPFGISARTPFYLYPNVFLREYLAVAKSYILDNP